MYVIAAMAYQIADSFGLSRRSPRWSRARSWGCCDVAIPTAFKTRRFGRQESRVHTVSVEGFSPRLGSVVRQIAPCSPEAVQRGARWSVGEVCGQAVRESARLCTDVHVLFRTQACSFAHR